MFGLDLERLLDVEDEYRRLEDYQGSMPRWCSGCGDNAILTAVQRLLRDEGIPPEKAVFVSGIGCSSRFPHYMNAYGFHGVHGRALPIAQGIKIRRPDLHVFVNMGDGDCFSIGSAHWIHAIHYNINMLAIVHDNRIYGLTKKQVSPTSPKGLKTNTTPYGSYIEGLNPLTVTLGVTNVSFVAQAVEWIPDLLYAVIRQAFHHRGFSFVRVLQRCPTYLPDIFDPFINDPQNILILTHESGLQLDESLAKIYRNRVEHDPSDIHRAREIASDESKAVVGILYRNERVDVYDEIRRPKRVTTLEMRKAVLERELDKFAVNPVGGDNHNEKEA